MQNENEWGPSESTENEMASKFIEIVKDLFSSFSRNPFQNTYVNAISKVLFYSVFSPKFSVFSSSLQCETPKNAEIACSSYLNWRICQSLSTFFQCSLSRAVCNLLLIRFLTDATGMDYTGMELQISACCPNQGKLLS